MEQAGISSGFAGSYALPAMNESEFLNFSSLIYSACGINISASKKAMLTSRLFRRLKALDINDYGMYYDYLVNSREGGSELEHMINAVSTNTTEFFREMYHFEFLKSRAIKDIIKSDRFMAKRSVRAWSAGCSSGEEPYSIAKVLDDCLSGIRSVDYSVLATDISTSVLDRGRAGVYESSVVDSVPDYYKKKYLMKGKGPMEGFYKIVPEIRSRVSFNRINLKDREYNLGSNMDIIFCRNVVIYFDNETQKKVYERLCGNLAPGGYLFIGHSETLSCMELGLKRVYSTVYQKKY